jgi:hypothetical protein
MGSRASTPAGHLGVQATRPTLIRVRDVESAARALSEHAGPGRVRFENVWLAAVVRYTVATGLTFCFVVLRTARRRLI